MTLALADAENLGPTDGACPLRGRASILECNGLGVLDFPLGPTLHTICLHVRLLSKIAQAS